MGQDTHQLSRKMDRPIFYSAIAMLTLFTLPLVIWPDESLLLLNDMRVVIEDHFGSVYQILAIWVLGFVLWMAFSKFGKVRFGPVGYDFGTFSWASMLFCQPNHLKKLNRAFLICY